jgi:hypothetical protein
MADGISGVFHRQTARGEGRIEDIVDVEPSLKDAVIEQSENLQMLVHLREECRRELLVATHPRVRRASDMRSQDDIVRSSQKAGVCRRHFPKYSSRCGDGNRPRTRMPLHRHNAALVRIRAHRDKRQERARDQRPLNMTNSNVRANRLSHLP